MPFEEFIDEYGFERTRYVNDPVTPETETTTDTSALSTEVQTLSPVQELIEIYGGGDIGRARMETAHKRWGYSDRPSVNEHLNKMLDHPLTDSNVSLQFGDDGQPLRGSNGETLYEQFIPGITDRPDYDSSLATGDYPLSNTLPGQVVAPFVEPFVAGAKELTRSGNIDKSLTAFAQASDSAFGVQGQEVTEEGKGLVPTVYRISAQRMRNILQELNDRFLYDIPAALGVHNKPTTFQDPDGKFLGIAGPLPTMPTTGAAEEIIGGFVQAGISIAALRGLGLPSIPGVPGLVTAPVLTPLRSGNVAGTALGLLKRGAGLFVEGQEYGAILDFFVYDQHSGRMADLADKFGLRIPYTKFLLTDPSDVGIEGSLKNLADGLIYGGPIGLALGGGGQTLKGALRGELGEILPGVAKSSANGDLANAWSSVVEKVFKNEKAIFDEAVSSKIELGEADAPGPLTTVDQALISARRDELIEELASRKALLDELIANEPPKPLKGEKSKRASNHRTWVTKKNKLTKEVDLLEKQTLAADNKVLRSKGTVVTGKDNLTLGEEVDTGYKALPIEEAISKREAATAELDDAVKNLQEKASKVQTLEEWREAELNKLRARYDELGPEPELPNPPSGGRLWTEDKATGDFVLNKDSISDDVRADYEQQLAAYNKAIIDYDAKASQLKADADNFDVEVKRRLDGVKDVAPGVVVSGEVRDFTYPTESGRGKPRPTYGRAKIIWESELDMAAWIIRPGRKRYPVSYDAVIQKLEAEGFNVKEIEKLGTKIHDEIKADVKAQTGSAKASPENTEGLTIEVPAHRGVDRTTGRDPGTPPPPPPETPTNPGPEFNDDFYSEIRDAILQRSDDLRLGKVTLDELMPNEIRRLVSRSGKTQYAERPSEELVIGLKGLSDVFEKLGKESTTGIPTLDFPVMQKMVYRSMRQNGMTKGDIDKILPALGPLRKINEQNQRTISYMMALDTTLRLQATQTATLAVNWQNRKISDVSDLESLAKQLFASISEFTRGAEVFQNLGRGDAQRLASRQMKAPTFYDAEALIPPRTTVQYTTDKKTANKILSNGFQITKASKDTLVGDAVYFDLSSDLNADAINSPGKHLVAGSIPANVTILDLPLTGKSINELLEDSGIGLLKGKKLSIDQQLALASWLDKQGYDGIRVDNKIAIFNPDIANEIVGSNAPRSGGAEFKVDVLDYVERSIKEKGLLGQNVKPEIQEAIETGNITPDVEEFLDELTRGFIDYKDKEFGKTVDYASRLAKANPYTLTRDLLLDIYGASLLWSPTTMATMALGGALKSATLPLLQATGGYVEAGIKQAEGTLGIRGRKKLTPEERASRLTNARRTFRRANQQWQLYNRMAVEIHQAATLARLSYDEGVALNSTRRSFAENIEKGRDQEAIYRLGKEAETESPIFKIGSGSIRESSLDNPGILDPNFADPQPSVRKAIKEGNYLPNPFSANYRANALRWLWQKNNMSLRGALAIDTFFGSMVSKSHEYLRFYIEALEDAEVRGLGWGTEEAAEFATKRASERLEDISIDVQKRDGTVIKNGIVTGQTAENVTNWTNFTSDLWAKPDKRSFKAGLRIARDNGLEGDEAVKFANQHEASEAVIPKVYPRFVSAGGVAWQEIITHAPEARLLQFFNRTPINILKDTMRSVPGANFLEDNFWKNIQSDIPEVRYRTAGEIAVGTLVIATGAQLLQSGLVKVYGAGPIDGRENREWRKVNGIPRGYHFQIKNLDTGGYYAPVDFSRLDTFALTLGGLADWMENIHEKSDEEGQIEASELIMAFVQASAETAIGTLDRQMFEGFNTILRAARGMSDPISVTGDKINPGIQIVQTIASRLMPFGGSLRLFRKGNDPYLRGIPANNFGGEMVSRWANQTVGSKFLPPRLDPIGGEPLRAPISWGTHFIPENLGYLRGAVNAVNPAGVFPVMPERSIVHDEIANLHQRGKSFDFFPPDAFQRRIKLSQREARQFLLSYEQHNKLISLANSVIPIGESVNFLQNLEYLINDPNSIYYQYSGERNTYSSGLSQRAQIIRDVHAIYLEAAMEAFLALPENEDFNNRYLRARAKQGELKEGLSPKLVPGDNINTRSFIQQLN